MRKPTDLVHLGRDPERQYGLVNTPVYRGSTVLFPTLEALEDAVRHPYEGVYYGRFGTPTHFALQDALSRLEGAHGTVLAGCGLAAVNLALLAFARSGDHVLIADCVYAPTRQFCDGFLQRFGVEVGYFDPAIGAGIVAQIKPNTRAVLIESPGSLTFEIQDIPAIATVAHKSGATVIADNTWATPLFCNPLALGADVVVHAATKYIVGHADAMLGAICCSERTLPAVRAAAAALGACASPDDCYLALRGLRTLEVRLARHQETALTLARWLSQRPEVARVLHPALPDFPGNALWKRDFRGASGLFGVALKPVARERLAAMLDGLVLFGMGFSWGGFESLLVPAPRELARSAARRAEPGPLLRIHAGLEDPNDLISELDAALARLHPQKPMQPR